MAQSDEEIGYATIRIATTTRDRLKNLGTMSDTMDSVIVKLIDVYEKDRAEGEKKVLSRMK